MAEEGSERATGADEIGPDVPDPWDEETSSLPPPPAEQPEATDEPAEADDSAGDADLDLPAWMTKPAPGTAQPAGADNAELVSADIEGLLPAVSSVGGDRRDATASAVGALSMRIDSLIAATTTYRSLLSDRLTEYADLVNRLNRTQATDLDEFRKANERTVGEIRRTMGDSEDALRNVGGQSEQMITEMGLLAEFVRGHAADSRELIDATDKLGRFVTGALDQFADRVLGELRSLSDNVVPELNTLRTELSMIRESLDGLNERVSSAPVREAIDELRADFSGLRRAVIEWPDLEVARSEIVAMRAELTEMIEAFRGQGNLATEVAAMRDLIGDLSEQLEAIEAREVPAPVSSGEVSNEVIESLRDEVKALRRRIQVRAPD